MTATPNLLYLWGDDDLAARRTVARMAAALADQSGAPLDRWELHGARTGGDALLAQLSERVQTPVMFGGGTLAIVSGLRTLLTVAGAREAVAALPALVGQGNALAFLDLREPGKTYPRPKDGPPQKRVAKAVEAAGGVVRATWAPSARELPVRITAEARELGLTLAPGAAQALADRLTGGIDQSDVERRYQSTRAAGELAKLSLYRPTTPITADDVAALVAEDTPGSMFGFLDAVTDRQSAAASDLLERLWAEGVPEPVLTVMLHRRLRDLIEVKDRLADGAKPAEIVAATRLHPFVAEKLARASARWSLDELTAALAGVVELDAAAKGVPGMTANERQRRLRFGLWVLEHATRADRPAAAGVPG